MGGKRLYKTVADDLLRVIDSGEYNIGERLPAERDLATKYNVSRPTVREAVIALEIAGRVEVRKGAGVFIINPIETEDDKSLDLDVGPFELTEARLLIEGETAALAATQITTEEIAELEAIILRMKDENEQEIAGEPADKEFHTLIARATRNSALELTMYKTVRLEGVRPSIQEHWDIWNALKRGDSAGARLAMRTHLSRVIETMFKATEIEAVEKAKRKVSADRERFTKLMKGN